MGIEQLLELRGDGDRGRCVRGGVCLGLDASPRFEGERGRWGGWRGKGG